MKAKRILKDMRVGEISLVDEGDNPHADVVIMKRRAPTTKAVIKSFERLAETVGELNDMSAGAGGEEGQELAATILKGVNMDIEALNTRLGEIEDSLDTVTKDRDAVTKERDELKVALAAAETARDEAIAKAKGSEPEDEDEVLKALPVSIRKRLEAAEKDAKDARESVEKANAERDTTAAIAKAKELGIGDADKLGPALMRIAKGKSTAEDATLIEETLAVAKTVAAKGGALFERIGKKQAGDADGAQSKLDDAIENIRKAKPALTREQAYTEALDANPGLYDEISKGLAAAA